MLQRTVLTRLLGIGVLTLTVGCATGLPVAAGPMGALSKPFPRSPVSPVKGAIFSSYKAPLSADVEGIALGSKTGTSSTLFLQAPLSVLPGLPDLSVGFGDASVEAAMADGGITELTHLDYEVTVAFAVFGNFTVIAHGN